MTYPSPTQWMQTLVESFRNTSTRIDGEDVPLETAYEALGRLLANTRDGQASVWWVGNGGSASICSHLAQDVLNKLGLRSQALSDSSLLTCMANDFGYAEVYSRALRKMVRPGDLLIAISSSGNSDNILNSAEVALDHDLSLVTLSGFSKDNRLWTTPANIAFHVESHWYGIVEVAHLALLHSVIESLYFNRTSSE